MGCGESGQGMRWDWKGWGEGERRQGMGWGERGQGRDHGGVSVQDWHIRVFEEACSPGRWKLFCNNYV